MDRLARQFVLDIIGRAKDMTLATVRPDGYPQATTVSYASEDLTLYVGIGKESQKAHNIHANHKVSLTINSDYKDWNQIKGISIGGVAEVLTEPKEVQHAIDCMIRRFPQLSEWEKNRPST